MDVIIRKCRNCGKLIAMVPVEGQGRIPCQNGQVPYARDPQARGEIITSYGQRVRGRQVMDRKDADGFGWIPHYADCRRTQEMNEIMKQRETLFPTARC